MKDKDTGNTHYRRALASGLKQSEHFAEQLPLGVSEGLAYRFAVYFRQFRSDLNTEQSLVGTKRRQKKVTEKELQL